MQLYLTTVPKPQLEGTDALFQEIGVLQQEFGGETVSIFPLQTPNSWTPRFLYGFWNYNYLKSKEKDIKFHHIFSTGLHWYPILRRLEKPLIISVVASLDANRKYNISKFNTYQKIVVSNKRDQELLNSFGLKNHVLIRPGLDLRGFESHDLKLKKELKLLVASAPWEAAQFYSKGIDFLLQALLKMPHLKLVLLWRGLLEKELLQRLDRLNLRDRVEVINKRVNVNDYLKKVHATILMSEKPELVKAFPHSLIESIVSGKPVILSDTIPMADYVKEKKCGVVSTNFSLSNLMSSIEKLSANYDVYKANCVSSLKEDFSIATFVEKYKKLYEGLEI